jgi:uncharacterized SAM-binding protein YcdF (DUF218 family)
MILTMKPMKIQSPLLDRRSHRPDRRAHRGRFTRTIVSLLVLLFLLPAVPHLLALREAGPPPRPADAIFVLTGGEGRIQEGYRAWSGGAARELYILGAGVRVPVARIVPEGSRLPDEALSRIHVEGWSENTLENAFSAKSAVGERKYSSVILVTSDYHVPRAVLAFRTVLPPEVALSAIRVRPEGGAGASWRWARRHFLEGWKYWGYRILLRWE